MHEQEGDIRNTKVVDIYHTMSEYTNDITVYDPRVNVDQVKREYGLDVVNDCPKGRYDAVILAVAHNDFIEMDVQSLTAENGVIYDVKGVLPREIVDGRL